MYRYSRDHFYQFGEIRMINVVAKQQCAFVQFTTRSSAEAAAEKSFNKLIVGGRRLTIKWGRSQGQQLALKKEGEEDDKDLEPVPGLPGGKLQERPEERQNKVYNPSFNYNIVCHFVFRIKSFH